MGDIDHRHTKPVVQALDFELHLRDAVAERRQRHVLKYEIRHAAKGGRIVTPFDLGDQGVRKLRVVAAIKARRILCKIELFSVRPDTADARNHPFAESDCERARVGVARLCSTRTAAAKALATASTRLCRDGFLEPRLPDHLPPKPGTSPDSGDRRPLA